MRGRAAVAIALSDDERAELEMRARRTTARADAKRAAIVLLAAAGESNTAIAARLGIASVTVTTWRNRFAEQRLQGLSGDPRFAEKIRDIVGLYLDPPDRALVLCIDEKPPTEALDRTRSVPPIGPPRADRQTHDQKRHGTSSLFVALHVATRELTGKAMPDDRAQEFRRFLDLVERNVPDDLDLHVVIDHASIHTTKLIRDWFARRTRWHVHFTPTSASWVNQVERFFGLLAEQQLRRGVSSSTQALEAAIRTYVGRRKAAPKPFRWTKTAHAILAALGRRPLAVHSQTV